ncbi:MAG: hypothetical protein OXU23_23385, partial [Candidatus Poribacteria bacterium]|nr:hypothetical protein [Candidatus Poribacteria bacterium]
PTPCRFSSETTNPHIYSIYPFIIPSSCVSVKENVSGLRFDCNIKTLHILAFIEKAILCNLLIYGTRY